MVRSPHENGRRLEAEHFIRHIQQKNRLPAVFKRSLPVRHALLGYAGLVR